MTFHAVRRGVRAALFAAVSLTGFAVIFFRPEAARADSLLGTIEFDYSLAEGITRTGGAETGRFDVQGFTQRYRLAFDKSLYPLLVVRGGGLFEKTDSSTGTGGNKTDSTFTRLNPYVELNWGNPLYNGAAGYNHQEVKQQSGGDSTKLIRDIYNVSLAWRPVDLPELTVQYTHNDYYDPGRKVLDNFNDIVTVALRYLPMKTLDLTYTGTLEQVEDQINGVKTQNVNNAGKVTYDDNFLDRRFFLHTDYLVSNRRTNISATRGSEVTAPVQALAGLFALDDTPLEEELPQAPALVDGNLTAPVPTPTQPLGIDIGLPAVGEPNGSVPRNLGLDLLLSDADVNGLWVWVDRPLTTEVAGTFRWEVYVSSDGLEWKPHQAALPAPFGPFENRFEIRFPRVPTRFVKVVVNPLAATVPGALNFPDIFVTELRAFLTLPAEQIATELSQTSQQVNVAARARLLDNPRLFYDFTLYYTTNQPIPVSRLLISNGLSLSQQLNPWLTGSALAARDDENEPAGKLTRYRYSASLNATPIPTLYHSAVYSGSTEKAELDTKVGTVVVERARNSIFLNNRATLYQGIDVLLNGGVSWGRLADGASTISYTVNFGADFRPNDTMTWSFFGSDEQSERSGGGALPDSTSSTQRARVGVAWNPLPTVNLYASAEVANKDTGNTTLYNWSLNWSPFREGTLQMIFPYNEAFQPEEDRNDRSFSPSLRWVVTRGTFLDLSYTLLQSKHQTQETETRIFSATFQANF